MLLELIGGCAFSAGVIRLKAGNGVMTYQMGMHSHERTWNAVHEVNESFCERKPIHDQSGRVYDF